MKVVIGTTVFGDDFVNALRREFPGTDFVGAYGPAQQAREVIDADVYFGWPDAHAFQSARSLRWIACPGTGIDSIIAIREIVDSDVVLTNAPGSHAAPMADWTLGMMIALAHKLPQALIDQRARLWDQSRYEGQIGQLDGRVLGLYGLGAIGRAVAQRAAAFDMRIHAVDPSPAVVPPFVTACWGIGQLDDLCRDADWFVVTAPYTAETKRSIDRRRIELLKQNCYVLVVSRGGIVDEHALAEAIASGRVAGAALDATEVEPLPEDSPLWTLANVIITPHVSAVSSEMYEGRRQVFRDNLRRFLAGEDLLHVCDKRAGY